MSKLKQLLLVLPLCLILAGFAVTLYLLDPTFEPDFYRITSMVIVTICAFFLPPSIAFAINYTKQLSQGQTFEESFKGGVRIGLYFGIAGLFILSFLVSPVTGGIWFAKTIQATASSIKAKKSHTNDFKEKNIFDI